ncbi:MAG TPA: NAD(P)-dependent alcohol dehydrogenase [Actinobacteria bacterium]|jgi:NADPH:quinone reductase-like Zn-dependent oxidoreductase|nr:NAD(P)-dependent alcohol dehydrogenase [Actinomycetota bacterium]
MKAITQASYGGPQVLELADIPTPQLKDDEVLIRVRNSSINAGDDVLMKGDPYLVRAVFGLTRPRVKVRGRDTAGEVATVGAAVTRFEVGDEVYCESSTGSFAEFTRVPEKFVARKPNSLTMEQAGCVPLAAVTALQGLRKVGKVQPGQQVLIIGASGGVGSYAVQIAKALGATVTGVCSSAKVAFVRSLGADAVIDYSTESVGTHHGEFDVIFDIAGVDDLHGLRSALKSDGILVLAGGKGGKWLGPMRRSSGAVLAATFRRQKAKILAASRNSADLEFLTELFDAGSVTPYVDSAYPLNDVPAAFEKFESGQVRGKIAIKI